MTVIHMIICCAQSAKPQVKKDTKLFRYYSQYAFFSFSKIPSSKLMLLILHCFYNFAAYKWI